MQTGLKRGELDKFYTCPKIAKKYIEQFHICIRPQLKDIIIEPSAGCGSFSDILFNRYRNVRAYDISPEGKRIRKKDFFLLDLPEAWKKREIHIIGNPPFGRQSSLAKKFIRKSSEFANTIAFILPKSFKKPSMQSCFPTKFHLVFSEDVPKKAFLINSGNGENKEYDVPCVFQIWQKKTIDRITQQRPIPLYFKFVKKSESPDFAIRRVGGTSGNLSKNILDKSEQSHYFIKLEKDFLDFEKAYNSMKKFEHNNTVGPKSISKPEIITFINTIEN